MGWDGNFMFSKYYTKEDELETIKRNYFPKEYKILYETKVGSNWYFAIQDGNRVFACIVLTEKNGDEFLTKAETENEGPYVVDAPLKLINMLTPTDSQWANEWRDRVRAKHGAKSMANRKSSTPIKVSEAKEIHLTARRKDQNNSLFESTKYDKFNYQGEDVWAGKQGKKHYYPTRNDDEMKEHLKDRMRTLKNGYNVSVKIQSPNGTYIATDENELMGHRTAPRKKKTQQKKIPFKLNVRSMF